MITTFVWKSRFSILLRDWGEANIAGWEKKPNFWMRLYARLDDLICNLQEKNCENENEWKKYFRLKKRD